MKKNSVLLLVLSLLGSVGFSQGVASAQNKSWCKGHAYRPHAKSLTELKEKYDHKTRGKLVQALWYEVLQKNISGERVVPLLQYLANTEQKKKMTGYYQLVGMTIGIDSLDKEIEKWPNVTQPTTFKSNLQELCQIYEQAGGEDFK